jgi:hypothetical protein
MPESVWAGGSRELPSRDVEIFDLGTRGAADLLHQADLGYPEGHLVMTKNETYKGTNLLRKASLCDVRCPGSPLRRQHWLYLFLHKH